MECIGPCHGMDYNLRDSPGPTYESSEEHTPVYLSLHGGQKLYVKRGNAEQEENWSFQSIRYNPLSRKQKKKCHESNQGDENDKRSSLKCKVAEGKAERDVLKTKEMELKMERDALKTKEYELKIERNMLKTERDVIKTERDGLLTQNARLRRALRDLAQMISRFLT
ncbi:hypothetical protein NPIL_591481 [Nephila pilipes]|uniref:Uncharacterized protein n=1 Tax=Nephila pilipes TaxID=299642 RepID=A0A8X6QQ18_NEPPI|nr:hypothetical protein NPIL_591481 [Nephila pilipes]